MSILEPEVSAGSAKTVLAPVTSVEDHHALGLDGFTAAVRLRDPAGTLLHHQDDTPGRAESSGSTAERALPRPQLCVFQACRFEHLHDSHDDTLYQASGHAAHSGRETAPST